MTLQIIDLEASPKNSANQFSISPNTAEKREAELKEHASNPALKEAALQFHQRVKDIKELAATWRAQQTAEVPIKLACTLLEEAIKTFLSCAHNKPIDVPLREIVEQLSKRPENDSEQFNTKIGDLINRVLFVTTLKPQIDALSKVFEACKLEAGMLKGDLSKELTLKIGALQEAVEKVSFEISKEECDKLAGEMDQFRQRLTDVYSDCAYLDLSNRSLTILPSGLCFPHLGVLKLSNNYLADLPNWECSLHLRTFTMNNNLFTSVPKWLQLETIPNFELSNNPWDDKTIAVFKNLKQAHKITYSPTSGCVRRNSVVSIKPPLQSDSGSPWSPVALPSVKGRFPVPLARSRSNEFNS